MTFDKPRILVTGATGKVGTALVRYLRAEPGLEIVAGVRSPHRAAGLGVATAHLDFDRPETLAPAMEGVDRVFMMTAYTVDMFRQSKDFVNAARRAGVKHIVHLGACGDDDTRVAHWGWQQFVERYIEWAGFSFTHLRPDIFMQNLLGYGGSRPVSEGLVRHYVGDARISWVDCDDVAAVAALCLKQPEPHAGKTYRLASDVKTFHEVAGTLSQVVGKPFAYEPRPAREFIDKVTAAGADPAYMYSAYENYAEYSAGKTPEPGAPFGVLAGLLGRRGTTWAEFAARHRAEFDYQVRHQA
ncbi:SDR family oxidoreductase [Cupriavidus sp. 30B13]|uniref:SDR family oxidoreductase n=1 Tax=Cupriavidus sp. 30B13 TaxID=3384241 RepID=UPI003B8EDEB3